MQTQRGDIPIPDNHREAVKSPHRKEWRRAMKEEIDTHLNPDINGKAAHDMLRDEIGYGFMLSAEEEQDAAGSNIERASADTGDARRG